LKPVKERTRRLTAEDRKVLWHPFTRMSGWLKDDPVVVIEKGKGCWLIDSDGNRYLDGVSSLWCNIHGHNVKKIDGAVRKQLGLIAHSTLLGLASPPSIKLGGMLVKEAPEGLVKVFYSDSGSTAVEAAIKMALQYQLQTGNPEKSLFAGLVEAYHGDTAGSVSVGGMELFHSIFSSIRFDTVRIPSPYCYRCPENLDRSRCSMECAEKAVSIIQQRGKKLAAVIIEPLVQGAAGMIVHPEGYLGKIKDACEKNRVLLIADEVATGFGRTGTLFACRQEKVTPDILCLAKGLSGGYMPLAATLTTEKVFEAFLGTFESRRAFYHGHTYTGNPLGCAAAIASLKLLRSKIMPALPEKIDIFSRLLKKKIEPLSHAGDIRQKGLMAGIELVRDKKTKEPYPSGERTGHRVILEARRRGVMLRPLGDVIVLMPPLAISRDEIKLLVSAAAESISEVTG